MLGLDTNVLIRYLMADDPDQFSRAQSLVDQALASGQSLFMSHLVMMEAEWVLRSRYQLSKADITDLFVTLLESQELRFEDEASLEEALQRWKDSNVGFADCLIAVRNQRLGCVATATFDRKASRIPGYVLVADLA